MKEEKSPGLRAFNQLRAMTRKILTLLQLTFFVPPVPTKILTDGIFEARYLSMEILIFKSYVFLQ